MNEEEPQTIDKYADLSEDELFTKLAEVLLENNPEFVKEFLAREDVKVKSSEQES